MVVLEKRENSQQSVQHALYSKLRTPRQQMQSNSGHRVKQPLLGCLSTLLSQQQVSDTLRGMGLSVEDEFRCPKSGYTIKEGVSKRQNAQFMILNDSSKERGN